MMLSRSSPDQVGRISLTSSFLAIGPSMPSTNSASPSHQNIAVQRSSLAATSDRTARNEPDAVKRWTENALACGQVTFFFGRGIRSVIFLAAFRAAKFLAVVFLLTGLANPACIFRPNGRR